MNVITLNVFKIQKKVCGNASSAVVSKFVLTHVWRRLIIDKPERNLKKGSGFHMDIVIMSMVNAMCGLFGAPWQCVATVRSVSHVAALTIMSTTHAPGDKPHIVEVKGTISATFITTCFHLIVGPLTDLNYICNHDNLNHHHHHLSV